ncbi:thioredoxin [Streptomyces sp. NPDC096176]|uniref:thioredoxin n=1 Tax=Streptomyces sp. NPDC096176 TaxID=3366079 RepID=UPI003820758D
MSAVATQGAATKAATVACTQCGRKNRVPAAAEGIPRCGNCRSPLPWITDAGDDDFAGIAEQATPVVLVDLWATWCGPCRMVSPALELVAREMAGTIKLVKVDVDQAPAVAQRFQVQAVPTLLLLDKGEVIDRQAGAAPAAALRQWVERAIAGRH